MSTAGRLTSFAYVALLACWFFAATIILTELHVQRWPLAVDFIKYYESGLLARGPERLHVYDPEVQRRTMDALIAPMKTKQVEFILYPPQTFALMIPISFLPMPVAMVLWCLVGPVLGCYSLWLLMKRAGCSTKLAIGIICGALASQPATHTYWFGQYTWFFVATICLLFYATLKRLPLLSGIAMAFTTIKLQYAPLLCAAAVPFIRKPVKVVAGVSLVLVPLLVTALLTIGPDNTLSYGRVIQHSDTDYKWQGFQNSLPGMWMCNMLRLTCELLGARVGVIVATAISLIAAASIFALSIYLSKQTFSKSRPGKRLICWCFALTVALCLTTGLHVREYDCLLYAVCAALTLRSGNLRTIWNAPIFERLWLTILYFYAPISWILYFTLGFQSLTVWSKAILVLNIILSLSGTAAVIQMVAAYRRASLK